MTISLIAGAGMCAAATAQTPSFIYSFQVANPNLSPGQTTTITVLCGYSPAVGMPVTTPTGTAPVVGLFEGRFDLFGTAGTWAQHTLITPYNFIGTSPGSVTGSSVSGVFWSGYFGTLGPPVTVNPVPLWRATFTAPSAPGNVKVTIVPVGAHAVWAGNSGEIPVAVSSQLTTGAQTIINVIPAPASLWLVGAGIVVTRQRRRSRP